MLMDNDFEELVHDFIKERTSEIVVSLREDDVAYQKAFRKFVDNSKAAEKVKEDDSALSAEEFKSLKIYLNSANEMGFIEHLTLYGAGYTDCIKLLRKLQVLYNQKSIAKEISAILFFLYYGLTKKEPLSSGLIAFCFCQPISVTCTHLQVIWLQF